MAFDEWKIKHQQKKEEKEVAKKEKKAELLSRSNDIRTELADRRDKAQAKLSTEEHYDKHLKDQKLNADIRAARQKLFIQRDKLIYRLINFNREYKYYLTKPDGITKQRGLERCSTGAKNAAYALAVVDDAIQRLDHMRSVVEWKEIMHDLTQGYKLMNKISSGSDLTTRLSFLMQKAKHDIKGDISVNAMEHYYGKPIDRLLEEQVGTANPADILVSDSVIDLEDKEAIMEKIRWGDIYNVHPSEFSRAAAQQSASAGKSGATPIIEQPEETFAGPVDIEDILGDMPSMMS